MSRNLIIILALGAVALTWGLLDGPAARQRRGAAQAQELEATVRRKIAGDPRFAAVDLSVMTNPALRVSGEVPDEDSLRQLRALLVVPPGALFHVNEKVEIQQSAASRSAH